MNLQSKLPLIRLIVFGVVLLFSFLILALSGHALDTMKKLSGGFYRDSGAFGVAMAVLTLASLGPLLVLSFLRRDAMTSKIIIELPVIGVLWVLWLACAALFADDNSKAFPTGCSIGGSGRFRSPNADSLETLCREYGALTAFAFFNWILLTAYGVGLLVITILTAKKTGNNAPWHATVEELGSEQYVTSNHTAGATSMSAIPPVTPEKTEPAPTTAPTQQQFQPV